MLAMVRRLQELNSSEGDKNLDFSWHDMIELGSILGRVWFMNHLDK